MATMITDDCINCGACEPECPNTAIYQGGVEWELDGVQHPPLKQDVFYIVPEKCTECVGFYDQEACAAVCPVDVCIPNPDIPESEAVLLERARHLHPGQEFGPDFPSRFRAGAAAAEAKPVETKPGEAKPVETEVAATKPAEAKAETKPAEAKPVEAKAETKQAAAKPAAPAVQPAAASTGARVEKPLSAPEKPAPAPARTEKLFPGELGMSFEETVAILRKEKRSGATLARWLAALGQPLLGALPHAQKRALEQAIADRRFFTAAGATGLNALHNMLLYPIVLAVAGALVLDRELFSQQLRWLIFLGVTIATLESIWRMREGFRGRAAEETVFRAAAYGLPLGPLAAPLLALVRPVELQGSVGQDGFRDARFGEKLERERRYGEVYRLNQEPNGFLLEFEFARTVPPSGAKEEFGVPDDMPDYDYELSLSDGVFVVQGRVTDPKLRKVAAVSPAFPPDFTTSIQLPTRVAGFRHRLRGKLLEVALPERL